MAVDTAYLHLTRLGLDAGKTILINGAGSTIGFAAVQIALVRGLNVIATAGEIHAQQLRGLGAEVTAYGDGLVERVRALTQSPVDVVLDTAPVGGALPDLIEIACALPEFVELAARGRFSIPVARSFPLEGWKNALEISNGGHARGKFLLLPGNTATNG